MPLHVNTDTHTHTHTHTRTHPSHSHTPLTERYLTMFHLKMSGVGSSAEKRRKFELASQFFEYKGHDEERPRYGAMNVTTKKMGDAKAGRYGKSQLVLRDHVKDYCTMTSCDTSRMEAKLGTPSHCAHVLLHMIELCDIPSEEIAEGKWHRPQCC